MNKARIKKKKEKKTENTRKFQTEATELMNAITEPKNIIEGFNSR